MINDKDNINNPFGKNNTLTKCKIKKRKKKNIISKLKDIILNLKNEINKITNSFHYTIKNYQKKLSEEIEYSSKYNEHSFKLFYAKMTHWFLAIIVLQLINNGVGIINLWNPNYKC